MSNQKLLDEFRLSERTVLRPGDKVRASGGPAYVTPSAEEKRIGVPGIYRIDSFYRARSRIFVNATKIDKDGMPAGTYTLFISGKPFTSPLGRILNRPYKITKLKPGAVCKNPAQLKGEEDGSVRGVRTGDAG